MSQELNLDALERIAHSMPGVHMALALRQAIARIRELEGINDELLRAQPAGEAEHSIPPIFYNGETKRNPEFKARVEKWTDEQNRKLSAAIDRTFAAPPAAANQAGITEGWISVDERLPDYGVEVLLYRPNAHESCDPVHIIRAREKGNTLGPFEFRCVAVPTHWMPLTAPCAAPHTESHALGGAMNDRELLEMAAKAARIDYHIDRLDGCPKLISDGRVWNPLVFDGDALRLAAKLRISIDFKDCCAWSRGVFGLVQEFWGGDYPDCYRNAIVRAAAEIGQHSYPPHR